MKTWFKLFFTPMTPDSSLEVITKVFFVRIASILAVGGLWIVAIIVCDMVTKL